MEAFESLLNNGFFYLNRHCLVNPSHPPEPTPTPCGKFFQFNQTNPKKPIEGIPNTNIKPLNKKTREIEELSKKAK